MKGSYASGLEPDPPRYPAEMGDVRVHEAHHRIQNSLFLVAALLDVHRRSMADSEARDALQLAFSQVLGIAHVHRMLQDAEGCGSLELSGLLAVIADSASCLSRPGVEVVCGLRTGVRINAEQAVPLCLICTELVTNALKHAFPPGRAGTVTISVVEEGGILHLTVADTGIGSPVLAREGGLGVRVVRALTQQVHATLETRADPGIGTVVQVRMPVTS